MTSLSKSARRVQEFLLSKGEQLHVLELPYSTRTAVEAAEAAGCSVGQIVKSLVFMGTQSETPVLVLASGPNQVDTERIAELIGEPVCMAKAKFVKKETGFAVGGVPPVGHTVPLKTVMDEDLEQYETIWAAAGTPHAVFQLSPETLKKLADPVVAKVG